MKQRLSLAFSAAAFVLAVLGITPLGQAAGNAASDAFAVVAGQAKGSLQAIGIVKRGPAWAAGPAWPAWPAWIHGAGRFGRRYRCHWGHRRNRPGGRQGGSRHPGRQG